MATLRKLIDGKAIGDTTQDLLDQVEQAQNSKNSYETEKHKLNLQMIPTKAALEYISQQHGLNPSQTPSPNNPDDMYTDLPSQGNQMNPRGGGRGTAEQSLPGKGELGEIGQNPGNRTGMVPGTPGRSIQAPNRERQLPPGQQQTMKKQAPFPKANKAKVSTKQQPRQFSVHVKAKAMKDCSCGGTCMSCRTKKMNAGGPGSGRHSEGGRQRTTFRLQDKGKMANRIADIASKLGYTKSHSQGGNTTYKHPSSGNSLVHTNTFSKQAVRVTLNNNDMAHFSDVERHLNDAGLLRGK